MRTNALPAAEVSWIVESSGILVFHSGGSCWLNYPEAAVWDLLVRGQDSTLVVRKVALIAGLDVAAAADLVETCVNAWTAAGLVEREAPHG